MINVGAGNIQAIKVGAEDAIKAYQGSTLVWTAGGPVYTALTCEYLVVETGETKIANTMGSLCTDMVVDGHQVEASNYYEFTTTGKHIVEWHIAENPNVVPASSFYDVPCLDVVHIPSTTTYIHMYAFNHCTGLTQCDMSGTAISAINSGAFQGCESLNEIVLPPATRIWSNAFDGCHSVTSITFNDALTRIDDYAFREVGELMHGEHDIWLFFPSGVTRIGNYAFAYVRTDDIELNEGLEFIGDEAFFGADELFVEIPSTVTWIGAHAFGQCPLENVTFKGSTPPSFGENPFMNDHLRTISVPSGSLAVYQSALPDYASLMVEY